MSQDAPSADQDDLQRALVSLAGLEKEFEKVDVDMLRETTLRQEPLFTRRNKITSQIRNFWPLTFEQAAAALSFDEYITPEDAHLLGNHLTGINVTRPDASSEPRTVQIDFTFSPNPYFTNPTLRKRFVHQPHGAGLASEPVRIQWREGKDLTEGVTEAAVAAWEERKAGVLGNGSQEERLKELMTEGPSSFFNWFLWTGVHDALGEGHEEHDDGCEGHGHPGTEVFPNGEEVAMQIAEDMYPNAPKYFTEALEEGDEDEDDEVDLETDEEELGKNGVRKRNGAVGADEEEEDDGPAKKKSRK